MEADADGDDADGCCSTDDSCVSVVGTEESLPETTSATPPATPPSTPMGSPTNANAEKGQHEPKEPQLMIHRAESYKRIVEAAEEDLLEEVEGEPFFFNRFKPTAKFVNIERVPRSRSVKIFEFFNVRKPERRIYESFPESRQIIHLYQKEDAVSAVAPNLVKPTSPRRLRDKQLDRRFWKQLSRRRGSKVNNPA